MCWRKQQTVPAVEHPVVKQKKILRCVSCGEELENNSLDAQMKHQAATGHRLYIEVLVQ